MRIGSDRFAEFSAVHSVYICIVCLKLSLRGVNAAVLRGPHNQQADQIVGPRRSRSSSTFHMTAARIAHARACAREQIERSNDGESITMPIDHTAHLATGPVRCALDGVEPEPCLQRGTGRQAMCELT